MLFSIIVPIYGVERFLPQCIESILEQSYKDYELILVDDGSKDHSGTICDEYARRDPRVKVIHKPNGGLVSARKAGAARAKGDYIIPVDGDDWIAPEMLLELSKVILQHDTAKVICFGIYQGGPDKKYKPKPLGYAPGIYGIYAIKDKIYPSLIKGKDGHRFPPNLCGKALKRETYKFYQNEVPDVLSLGEDAAVTYPLISQIDALYIMSECFYYYRWNLQSMTRSRKKGFDWDNLRILAKVWTKNLNTKYDFLPQINRYMCHDLFNVAKSHLQANQDFERAKENILKELNEHDFNSYIAHADFDILSLEQIPRILLKYRLVHAMKFLSQYV